MHSDNCNPYLLRACEWLHVETIIVLTGIIAVDWATLLPLNAVAGSVLRRQNRINSKRQTSLPSVQRTTPQFFFTIHASNFVVACQREGGRVWRNLARAVAGIICFAYRRTTISQVQDQAFALDVSECDLVGRFWWFHVRWSVWCWTGIHYRVLSVQRASSTADVLLLRRHSQSPMDRCHSVFQKAS